MLDLDYGISATAQVTDSDRWSTCPGMDDGDTRRPIGATTERLLPFRSSLAGEEMNQSATDKKSINGQGLHWNFNGAKPVTSETAGYEDFKTDDGENLEEMKEPSTHGFDVSASCKSMQQLRQLKRRCDVSQLVSVGVTSIFTFDRRDTARIAQLRKAYGHHREKEFQ